LIGVQNRLWSAGHEEAGLRRSGPEREICSDDIAGAHEKYSREEIVRVRGVGQD
jgi:hypothetical protein